jgi:hypothetical protein
MKVKDDNLEVITAASDQRDKEGYFVATTGVIVSSATAAPDAVILDGGNTGETTTLMPCAGGGSGLVKVKLNATPGSVVKGSKLVLVDDGTVKLDPGEGGRVIVAEAREPGTANERITAILVSPPIVFGS